MHSGVNDTMTFVRQKYWVPKLRQLTRSLLHKCVICRWIDGKCYSQLPLPPLPTSRVVVQEPFSTSGADFAGPLLVRTIEMERKEVKVYILLLTCSATRAIHLELVPDLSSSACIKALRRFIARRGAPETVISDNAKTFKSEETRQFLRDHGIKWTFILPSAPWTGFFM